MSPSRNLSTILLICSLAAFTACSSGGGGGGAAKIQPGTPAFFWSSARQAFQTGAYMRTAENLSKLTTADGEYRTRAEALQAVVASGIARGYMEYADAYDAGAKANKDKAMAFRKQASAARTQAKGAVMQALEAFHDFNLRVKDPQVSFEFGSPSGSLGDLPALLKVGKGVLLAESEAESTQLKAIQKGVVWSACRAVGTPDDSAKAMEILKQNPAAIAREKFQFGMAQTLFEQSELFGPKQLDDPIRMKMLWRRSADSAEAGTAQQGNQGVGGKDPEADEGRADHLARGLKHAARRPPRSVVALGTLPPTPSTAEPSPEP